MYEIPVRARATRWQSVKSFIKLLAHPKGLYRKIFDRINHVRKSQIDWDLHASLNGKYAVIDPRHPESELDFVTKSQREILFPILKNELSGNERTIMDFGCGYGRFTEDLANLISGRAIGVDISKKLLKLAKKSENTEFVNISEIDKRDSIPQVDVVWIALVLGGLKDQALVGSCAWIESKIKTGGLLFFAESTEKRQIDGMWWTRRTVDDYIQLFPTMNIRVVGEYKDAGQVITIFSGKRVVN